jgi:hypothetical protein
VRLTGLKHGRIAATRAHPRSDRREAIADTAHPRQAKKVARVNAAQLHRLDVLRQENLQLKRLVDDLTAALQDALATAT